jgi:hypothetical protein
MAEFVIHSQHFGLASAAEPTIALQVAMQIPATARIAKGTLG